MRRYATQANWMAYLGILMLLIGCYPFMDTEIESSRTFEAGWHLWLFIGAALLSYGLEILRRAARRGRRTSPDSTATR